MQISNSNDTNFKDAVVAFLSNFEEVFDRDWHETRRVIVDSKPVDPNDTFLHPDQWNWEAQTSLHNSYQHLLKALNATSAPSLPVEVINMDGWPVELQEFPAEKTLVLLAFNDSYMPAIPDRAGHVTYHAHLYVWLSLDVEDQIDYSQDLFVAALSTGEILSPTVPMRIPGDGVTSAVFVPKELATKLFGYVDPGKSEGDAQEEPVHSEHV